MQATWGRSRQVGEGTLPAARGASARVGGGSRRCRLLGVGAVESVKVPSRLLAGAVLALVAAPGDTGYLGSEPSSR